MKLLTWLLLGAWLTLAAGALELGDGAMQLKFSDRTYGCETISGGGATFGRATDPELFRIAMIGTDGKTLTVSGNAPEARRSYRRSDANTLEFTVRGLAAGDEKNALDVVATVRLAPGRAAADWTIAVTSRAVGRQVAATEFPILERAVEPGTADLLFPTGNYGGKLFKNNRAARRERYPSFTGYTQFTGFTRDGVSLYFGAHDPESWSKEFTVSGDQDLAVKTIVQYRDGQAAATAAPFRLALLKGDWRAMAKYYRSWAEAKAPWLRRGKLAERSDIPDSFIKAGPWFCLGWTSPAEIARSIERAQRNTGVPVALHYYVWHRSDFDTEYPELKPKDGFGEALKVMQAAGNLVMPYTNGHVWDNSLPSFAEAKPFAAMRRDGKLFEEQWGTPKRPFTGMCPATGFYQDFLSRYDAEFVRSFKLEAIYLDQVAAVEPNWCFDPKHGHPLGAGKYWIDGYRTLLAKLTQQSGGKLAITSECAQEMFIDSLSGNLMWLPVGTEDVPLLPYVYSGYTIYFGSPASELDSFDAFVAVQARALVWGLQPGWSKLWLTNQQHLAKAQYLGNLSKIRQQYHRYLTYGELTGELEWGEAPEIRLSTLHYTGPSGSVRQIETPRILSSIWIAADGSTGVFAVNTGDRWAKLDGTAPLRQSGRYRILADGVSVGAFEGNRAKLEEYLAPYEFKVWEIVPFDRDAKTPFAKRPMVPSGTPPPLEVAAPGELKAGPDGEIRLAVEVINRTGKALTIPAECAVPGKWTIQPAGKSAMTIPAAERNELVWTLAAPHSKTDRNYSATVKLDLPDGVTCEKRILLQVPKYEEPTVARYLAAVKIDGKLAEFAACPPIRLDSRNGNLKIPDHRGEEDLAAEMRLGWNETFLFFAAEVRDDVHHQPFDETRLWAGDGFQLSLLAGRNNAGGLTGNEIDIALALTGFGPELYNYRTGKNSAGGQVAIERRDGRTFYEAAIPWAELGIDPAAAPQLTWSAVLAENDGGDRLRGYIELTPGIFGVKNSSEYRQLKLEKR
ncbi:MAG: DUF6259 domain-containing protein [Victivallaceae bacterium]